MSKFMISIWALALLCLPSICAGSSIDSKAKALAHYIMAVTCDLNGQSEQALAEYNQSIRMNPSEPLVHLRLGAYYARVGLLDKSVAQLQIVLKLDPTNSQAHYLLALVYSSQNKYDLAAQEYELILKAASADHPGTLEIYIYLAQLYFSEGKYKEATEQFLRILKEQPDNVSANYLLGSCYLELNERLKARKSFNKVLTIEPSHDGALNSLAYMFAEDGTNLDDALTMIHKAIAIDGANGAYYDTLGWLLFKKGMNAQSLLALQKAEAFVQDPIIYEHMGDVYKAVKEFALARKFWRKSLELAEDQPHVKKKIEELERLQARQE